MNPTLLRLAKTPALASLFVCGAISAQEVREACTSVLHVAAYASRAADRQKSIDEFQSKNCVKDITDAFGPAGVPKAGSKSAMAMMAVAFASIKAGANLAAENERLRANKGTLKFLPSDYSGLKASAPIKLQGDVGIFKKGNVYQFETKPTPTGPEAIFTPIPMDRLKP